jgi:hypothetical protein
MTSDSRAVSTTSRLMTVSPLISSTRVIWAKSRWTSRKFPLVMRWDGGGGLGVGEVVCGQPQAECRPVALQDEGEFSGAQWPVFVDEPDAAAELGVAGQALFDAGHPDQDHAHLAAVVVVAQLLHAQGLEPVSLIDDQELGVRGLPCAAPRARGSDGPVVRMTGRCWPRATGSLARTRGVTLRVGVYSSVEVIAIPRLSVTAAPAEHRLEFVPAGVLPANRVLPTPG